MLEFIVMLVLGMIFIFIGYHIWKKENLGLIHEYHYKNVAKKDKKAYAAQMGKSCILIGIGMILSTGVDFILKVSYGWIFIVVFFVWGFAKMIMAQKKYNGGFF